MRYLIGLGSCTASDDAVGVRVIEHVVAHGLEQGFRAVDLSGGSLNVVAYLQSDTEAIVVVDCAVVGLAHGDFRFFSPDEVETQKSPGGVSTHEGDVLRVLELARALGYPVPPLVLMGIQPASVAPGLDLSPALARRLPEYAAAAIERLRSLGRAGAPGNVRPVV